MDRLRRFAPADARVLQSLKHWLHHDETALPEVERIKLAAVLPKSRALQTVYTMRRDLMALWARSTVPREHLVHQLQDWCQRAEASGIRPLMEFSQRLRCYA
jgi:stearoyl-CoA desaturase (delta-9 desaturase)